MPSQDLLLVLTEPAVHRHDLSQLAQACLTSDARHARHAGQLPEVTRIPDLASISIGGPNKRTLSQAFNADGTLSESQRQYVRLLSPNTASSTFNDVSHTHGSSACGPSALNAPGLMTVQPQPLVSFAHREPIIVPPPAQNVNVERLREEVSRMDQSSLMPTALKRGAREVWYTLCLKLRPSEASHPTYRYRVHRKELNLAVDTADSSFWLFQEGYQELYDEKGVGLIRRAWSEEGAQVHLKRRCLPRPPGPPMNDSVRMKYIDGGSVDLARWPAECDLTFSVPAWDWKSNQKSKATTLQFPQILAQAASEIAARQPVDGNLGLTVPGWRHPWKNADETDRVTFFDILREADCAEAVGDIDGGALTEAHLTVRLLIPPGNGRPAMEGARAHSFVYFGKGAPCGVSIGNSPLLLPKFSPAMRIFPDAVDPTMFRTWDLDLVSMTLLEPLVADPDYESEHAHQWARRRISMPDVFLDKPDGTMELDDRNGIRTVFDTCSGATVLPNRIVSSIWTDWFGQDLAEMPIDEAIWHRGPKDRFSKHDILFEFMDAAGETQTIRCSAHNFLTSPWSPPGQDDCTYTCVKASKLKEFRNTRYTLGMNFFWAFMVKFEATYSDPRPIPGTHSPTVQFAAQRIVQNGKRFADAWDLQIHPDLPPRLQNELRGCQIPELHPGDISD
ncbi:hypothetical protein K466DRAFT_668196 [Polyporus arcularius HHB13444]|uniref:Uncharacterized protein n=1 Tax=Polyporus arcularius HHB13444 TaxID=1314778 RepID=A0A5C3NNG6_9APHY|nr:hypothetical protein K466DRAFT_668196 [Polyporus arcularius HHB13444]